MTSNRKIDKFAATSYEDLTVLYATCKDGTVWKLNVWGIQVWEQLPGIPVEDKPAKLGAGA